MTTQKYHRLVRSHALFEHHRSARGRTILDRQFFDLTGDILDQYQPVAQSGAASLSASWTAGSNFNPRDFNNLNPAPFQVHSNAIAQEDSLLDGNNQVETIEELIASVEAHQQQGGGQPEEPLSVEDIELGQFFERFAETLPR